MRPVVRVVDVVNVSRRADAGRLWADRRRPGAHNEDRYHRRRKHRRHVARRLVSRLPALPDDLFAGAADTIVVDTGNYYPQ